MMQTLMKTFEKNHGEMMDILEADNGRIYPLNYFMESDYYWDQG